MTPNNSVPIKITHFVNPHLFWFKNANEDSGRVDAIELKLQEHLSARNKNEFSGECSQQIKVDDHVAVYMIAWSKWIRATVDFIDTKANTWILWAIDYGIPLQTSCNLIVYLDDDLFCGDNIHSVSKGGIYGILPSKIADPFKNALTTISSTWDAKAIRFFSKLQSGSDFLLRFALVKTLEDHHFGHLEIDKNGACVAVSVVLSEELKLAVKHENFKYVVGEIDTVRINRWLNNAGELQCQKNVGSIPEPVSELEEGSKIMRPLNIPPLSRLRLKNILSENEPHNKESPKKGISMGDKASPAQASEPESTSTCTINMPLLNRRLINNTVSEDEPQNKEPTFKRTLIGSKAQTASETDPTAMHPLSRRLLKNFASENELHNKESSTKGISMGVKAPSASDLEATTTRPTNMHPFSRQLMDKIVSEPEPQTRGPTFRRTLIGINVLPEQKAGSSKTNSFVVNWPQQEQIDSEEIDQRQILLNFLAKTRKNRTFNEVLSQNAASSKGRSDVEKCTNSSCVASSTMNSSRRSSLNHSINNPLNVLENLAEPKVISKIDLSRILAHSNIPIKPIHNISEAFFTKEVHAALKRMHLQEVYISQAYSWPNLTRKNSLILVDSKFRGKTVAYVPAVCSLIQLDLESNQRQQSMVGATAIILCPTSTVRSTADLCRMLMQTWGPISGDVVQAIGTRDLDNVASKLYNGCNILVTTAPCLTGLMKKYANIFTNGKLRHFIFENIDLIMDKHHDECSALVKEFCTKPIKQFAENRQIIVTSRSWHPILKKFFKHISNPLLLIGNFLEAAMYANMKLYLEFTQSALKMDKILDYLKSIPIGSERALIVCNENDEAVSVAELLQAKQIPHKVVEELETESDRRKLDMYWNQIEGILICSDDVLKNTDIQNAQHIIHYTMPKKNYKTFLNRFSTSNKFYQNMLSDEASDENKSRATSLIVIDEQNNRQLPKLVSLLTRDCQMIPQNIRDASKKIRARMDQERAESIQLESVCSYLFMHGRTDHETNCRNRHLLTQADVLSNNAMPSNGAVRLHIIKILSPTHYLIRPLEAKTDTDADWRLINQSKEFVMFSIDFASHYTDPEVHQMHYPIALGDLCVIIEEGKPHRCEIIKIYEANKRRPTEEIRLDLRQIDSGEIVKRKSTEILKIADRFRNFPRQTIDMHLTGIVPADLEDEWDHEITEKIEHCLDNLMREYGDLKVEANILFALQNILIVDMVRLISADNVVFCSIKKYMIDKKFGKSSTASRLRVIEMAKTIGVNVHEERKKDDTKEVVSVKDEESCTTHSDISSIVSLSRSVHNRTDTYTEDLLVEEEIKEESVKSIDLMDFSSTSSLDDRNQFVEKWASLSDLQPTQILITTFYTPDNFYIQIESELIKKLYKAIDEYATKANLEELTSIDIGNYCLVKIDNGFNRGKINQLLCDNSTLSIKVFCVDIGEFKNCAIEDLFNIPKTLIEMLPFQAIWCKMFGIQSVASNTVKSNQEWSDNACNYIYDKIDAFHALSAHFVSIDMEIKCQIFNTDIKRHNIILAAKPENETINLNDLIVTKGYAEYDPTTKDAFEKRAHAVIALDKEEDEEDKEEEDDEEKAWELVEWTDEDRAKVQKINQNHLTPIESSEQNIFSDISDDEMYCEFSEKDFESIGLYVKPSKTLSPTAAIEPIPSTSNSKTANMNNLDEVLPLTSSPSILSISDNNYVLSADSSDLIDFGGKHGLKYKFKRPMVHWQQSDELIVLQIQADENIKYNLEVNSDYLIYSALINDETHAVFVNFFGCIDYEFTIHELRGLNLIIRLKKSCSLMPWPHLMKTNEKCQWLKYNFNAIRLEDVYLDNNTKEYYLDDNAPIYSNSDTGSESEYSDTEAEDFRT